MNKLKIFFSLVLPLCLISVISSNVARAETQLDYDVPNGHFYTQGNGQGGAGGTGFTISNDGGIPFWSEFQRWGGVQILGYPVSRRFVYKGLTIQVMQRAVLQWNPTDKTVYFLNTFDELHAAGLDSWLRTVRSIPNQGTFDEVGKSWDQIVEGRLALLNANPAIRTKFYSVQDPIPFFGLPTSSVEDFGILSVIRCQRNVLQQWKVDVPWAKAGEVTIANGGDIAKEAGLFDPSALIPELPPGVTPPPTPTPTPTVYPFSQYGPIEYGANCGVTQVKIYAADVNDNPLYGIRFHIRHIDGWGADSNASGCCLHAPGWTDFALASEPKAAIWSLWAIDANGNRISPAVGFATDARDCGEGGSGHQIVTVHWKANYAGAYGENWTLVDADKPYQYDFGRSAVWYSDCKTTKISVYVHDVKGDPVNGVRIHISSDGWEADSFPTGENFPDGWTDFRLADEAKAATWSLWVVGAGGERISPIVKLTTDDVNCEEGGSGHQVATINWTKKF